MGKLIGLHKRGNIWRIRRWVPLELRSRISRTELIRSLRTTDYKTALQRYRTVSTDIEAVLSKACQRPLNGDCDWPRLIQGSDTVELQIKAPPSIGDGGLKTLIKTVVEEVMGKTSATPSITIDALYHRYMDDPARSRSKKTIMTYHSVYNVLIEVFGKDKLIADISRDDCRRFMDIVRHLPANAKKKFPRESLMEISSLAKERGMKPMAPLTINKYLSKLSALLSWAVEEEMLDRNPAKNLSVADPVHAQDKRLPFSDHQLQKIFTALEAHDGPEYWVPHIGLYNGMRLNEICQLNVEDVQQHDGIWCFSITREVGRGIDDKVLKTKASERVVPIHPELIELGFMRYLKKYERKPRSKLFPDIKPGTTGYRSDVFSKWFSRFLKSIDAAGSKTSFHSFRHNFRDALREADVRDEIAMLLGGWSDRSNSNSVQMFYGRGFMMKTILSELNKVHYPCL